MDDAAAAGWRSAIASGRTLAVGTDTEVRAHETAATRVIDLGGIRVAVPVDALEARLTGLPEGVSVEADRIEVRFTGAKEAVVRLFALAQALTNDYERFEALVGKGERSSGGARPWCRCRRSTVGRSRARARPRSCCLR